MTKPSEKPEEQNNSETQIITIDETPKDLKKLEKELDSPMLKYIENIPEKFKPRTNCKFCMSEHREIAEIKYEETKSVTAAFNLLKSKGSDASYAAVKRHINSHYRRFERYMKIKEWGENIPELLNIQKARETTLKDRIAILTQELYILSSNSDDEGTDNKLKTIEAVRKLSDSITLLEDKLAEEQQRTEPIIIVIHRMRDIIQSRVQATNNNAVKNELLNVMKLWMESVSDLGFITTS